MRKAKCPVCASEVPGTALRSGPFLCPACGVRLRVREANALLTIPFAVCGYLLTYLIARLIGLKGNALLLVTAFVGVPATYLVAAVAGALSAWVFCRPLALEKEPEPSTTWEVLRIESSSGPRKGPESPQ